MTTARLGGVLGVLAAVAGAPGCVEPPAGTVAQAITSGELDEGDAGVVALLHGGTAFCTGTLISRRVVVTAAHCAVLGVDAVYVGSAPADGRGTTVEVADVRVHAAHDAGLRRHDVALLLLRVPVPDDVVPWPIATAPLDGGSAGRSLRVVGFGAPEGTAAGLAAPFQKRSGTATLDRVDGVLLHLVPGPSQTCYGDSGGPAFVTVDGVEHLVGVTSYGDPACAGFAVDAHLPHYVDDFIAPYLAATAAGAAGPGERCFTDDGCATGTCVEPADTPGLAYCAPACGADGGCPGDLRCEDTRCRHPVSPGTWGTSCAAPWDCVSGLCLDGACATPCDWDGDCGSDETCVADGDQPRSCVAAPASGGCAAGGSPRAALALVLVLLLIAGRGLRLQARACSPPA